VKRRPLAAHRRPALRGANGSGRKWPARWQAPRRSDPPPAHRAGLLAGARNDQAKAFSLRARLSFAPRKRKAPDPIPSDGAGGGTGIHLDRARRMKSGRRNADRRVYPTSAPATFILPRLRGRTEEGARRASSGTRSPVGVPPRRLRQRTNAAAQLQHALPGMRLAPGVTWSWPVPVQRASRRPVMVPAGRFPGAARERRWRAAVRRNRTRSRPPASPSCRPVFERDSWHPYPKRGRMSMEMWRVRRHPEVRARASLEGCGRGAERVALRGPRCARGLTM